MFKIKKDIASSPMGYVVCLTIILYDNDPLLGYKGNMRVIRVDSNEDWMVTKCDLLDLV